MKLVTGYSSISSRNHGRLTSFLTWLTVKLALTPIQGRVIAYFRVLPMLTDFTSITYLKTTTTGVNVTPARVRPDSQRRFGRFRILDLRYACEDD